MAKKRRLWLLSVGAGLLGLIIGAMLSAPVFVDTFHSQHLPTFFDILIPNLLGILPYALGPALLVILAGCRIKENAEFKLGHYVKL